MKQLTYFIALAFSLALSMGANAHPGHDHSSHSIDGFVLLALVTGLFLGFYCLTKAKPISVKH